jgi:uncharacterized iron-regulated membrane protein
MNIKKKFRKLHLWIGLPGAVFFFFICITGSIFVFADEIMDLSNRRLLTVSEVSTSNVSIEKMVKAIKTNYPEHRISYLVAYKDPRRTVKFLITNKAWLTNVFINPYTGEIVGQSRTIQFFYMTAHLHSMLLWHGPGSWIIKICTILFGLGLVSGLVLWWPKNLDRNKLRNAFTYKSGMSLKRFVHDTHRIWGFYGAGILLVLTLTGLTLGFESLNNAVSRSVGGDPGQDIKELYPADSLKKPLPLKLTIDKYLKEENVQQVSLSLYSLKTSAIYRLITGSEVGILTHKGSVHLINQYTGEELKNKPATIHMETGNMLIRLHTGKYWGWAGEAITFLAGLLGAYLSITGIMAWWYRRK